jgi:SAM-dependent methyltransferase
MRESLEAGSLSNRSKVFADPVFAKRYEEWYAGPGRRADRLEKQLLVSLLGDFSAPGTALDIGCGTGHFSRWLAHQGLRVIGVEISSAMLERRSRMDGVSYVLGDALALPFADRSFDLAVLVTTLEFVDDPASALREAIRVARVGLLFGTLNRCSLLAVRRKASGKAPWDMARFFSPHELAGLVRDAAGGRMKRTRYRTTLWPLPCFGSLPLPWGGFIGMSVGLHPS